MSAHPRAPSTAALAFGALGVVYGDIGTSPLYAIRVAFGPGLLPVEEGAVLGLLSLVFWSLILIVTGQYVFLTMNADNRGEGGILAVSSLLQRRLRGRWQAAAVAAALVGAALFYSDGILTPAVSVLSAVEGLSVATAVFEPYIVPLTLVVLVGLFLLQRHGTARVSGLFGPIVALWFLTIGGLGLVEILDNPTVLRAVDPSHAVLFFAEHGWAAFVALGAVFLAVTGAEALYADMGHFGRAPIRLAWLVLVLPALLLNYFGQGALILSDPAKASNPFYLMVPRDFLYPMVLLASAATVIASQAVISGAFSLTRQAVQLGYLPRLQVLHTSDVRIGQIYIPVINWLLLTGVVLLVLGFRRSDNLAAAYGIAIVGVMTIDTVTLAAVARRVWRWPLAAALALLAFFLSIDIVFLGANLLKIAHGGWVPLLFASALIAIMSTWRKGRQVLFDKLRRDALSVSGFLARLGASASSPVRVKGTAVFMTGTPEAVPHALLHNLKHNKVLHERVVLMTVKTEDEPRVADDERLEVEALGHGFHRVLVRYGFKEEPDIPSVLAACARCGLGFELMETSFFLSRETVIPSVKPELSPWRERIFTTLSAIALDATEFFKIPPNRVVELGTQIEV